MRESAKGINMDTQRTLDQLIMECLEAQGIEYIFGLPGEENMRLTLAAGNSKARFILVRHEQAAAFMADIYGRLTGKAAVCMATLGPGAINLLLGVADAQTDSTPLVAISAQVGLNRIHKESHQIVDLVPMFKPVTKWADIVLHKESVPEMIRKAVALAETERPGAVYLAVPQDMEEEQVPGSVRPLPKAPPGRSVATPERIAQAAECIKQAQNPIFLVGHGAARGRASAELTALLSRTGIPAATTFMAKGVISDRHPCALGVIGFMARDYENFAFDQADLIISVGYEPQEFAPIKINPLRDKTIIHIHEFTQDEDAHYSATVPLIGNIRANLTALAEVLPALPSAPAIPQTDAKVVSLHKQELARGENDDAFPLKPQRIINDIRKAMGDTDIALVDTGALKMWMARLYPTYEPLTCLISNGLSTMAWSLPGAIGAKLAAPDRKVLAVMGDGAFMMNSQELETALREKIHFTVLIWEDKAYGLIKWKMDMELGRHGMVDFNNPDFVRYAESFGAKGYRMEKAADLLPALKKALDDDTVSVITCPVDYSENMALIEALGHVDMTL